MHMADALLSPVVGGVMWVASAALTIHASRRVQTQQAESLAPMMAVLGAFIFAAQMINFSIPGTGSSGHLGGGLLLAILLGPHAAFLTLASVLTVQALFFADGGLLALGCNIFNLGFFPCYIAYPLIYRAITRENGSKTTRTLACVLAAVLGLTLGACGVVLETRLSGISELPFSTFMLLMLPVHLAIGLIEGIVTAAVISFVAEARPEMMQAAGAPASRLRAMAGAFLVATLLTGGVLSWFASEQPDGLEWSIEKITGKKDLDDAGHELHQSASALQNALVLMPDYELRKDEAASRPEAQEEISETFAKPEKSLAGILGAILTLAIAGGIGLLLRRRRQNTAVTND